MVQLFTQCDNLDDRRELVGLLRKLPPLVRWQFVRGLCATVRLGNKSPEVRLDARDREAVKRANMGDRDADEYVTSCCWGFLVILSAQWELDLAAAAGKLESLVKRYR